MKTILVLLLLVLLVPLFNTGLYAQGEATVLFLMINPGARQGGMGEAGVALANAYQMLSHASVGSYTVSVSGSGVPGDRMAVQVSYLVPNYFAGLASFFGVSTPGTFSNTATSYFRQEGW